MSEEDEPILSNPAMDVWIKSMIESNGCVHDIEHYSEDGILRLVCKKCDKSWVV